MQIEYKGQKIQSIQNWERFVFSGKKKKHWKPGRSAYSLAGFILNNSGQVFLKNLISSCFAEEFELEKAYPEYEARFDKYGKGREHDLAIFGKTNSGKKLFIGVEAKVDESFGDTIATAYHNAKSKELNKEKTNAPKRIEDLLNFNFKKINKKSFGLRYQLLFSTAGTLCVDADIHVLLVLVFKTPSYDNLKGQANKREFSEFMKNIKASTIAENHFKATLDGKELIILYKEINF